MTRVVFIDHGNAVSGASNRASSRVLETIFATELQRVLAGDFRLTLAVRRRTVRVVVSSVKGDLDGRCLIAGCSFEKPPRL